MISFLDAFKQQRIEVDMVALPSNSSLWETEAGASIILGPDRNDSVSKIQNQNKTEKPQSKPTDKNMTQRGKMDGLTG